MIKKYFTTMFIALFMMMTIIPFGVEASQSSETGLYSQSTSNNARGTQYRWFYKEVDGQRYMRLYNATDCIWVTDWIPVEG